MSIEKQVVSLKIARELDKEDYLRFAKNCSFWWYDEKGYKPEVVTKMFNPDCIPAPTMAELGEVLRKIKFDDPLLAIVCDLDMASLERGSGIPMDDGGEYLQRYFIDEACNEADARAKLWLYLKKEGLIKEM